MASPLCLSPLPFSGSLPPQGGREQSRKTTVAFVACLLFVSPLSAAPPVTAVAFAPDGKSILSGSQAGIEIKTWPELKQVRTLATEIPNVHAFAFSPDGKTLAIAGGIPGKRGLVEFVSWPEGKRLRSAAPHRDSVYQVAWTADGAGLFTAGGDAAVCLVDPATTKTVRTFEGHSKGVLAVCLLPGGELVTAGLDETVRVWDAKTGEAVRTLSNHTKPVVDLSVRPGRPGAVPVVASVGEDRTVRLWQPTVGRLVKFARLDAVPTVVAWSADGSALRVAGKDGKVCVVDPESMAVTGVAAGLDGVAYCLAVGPDGSAVVGGSDGRVVRVK